MTFRLFCAFGIILGVASATIGAVAGNAPTVEATPIPAPSKPDFSTMQFLLGTWTCSTKSSRRPGPYATSITRSIDLTGYWIIQMSVNHKTAWAPELRGTDMTTFDSNSHRWVDVFTGDWGGYNMSTSPGWHGNAIVWTDAVISTTANVTSTTPTTVTRISTTKTMAHNTFKEAGGRVITVDTVCAKGTGV